MSDHSLILEPLEGPEVRPVELNTGESPTLGRSNDCNICLADPSVSRRHSSLNCRGNQWFIRDLHSRHGTFLNAVKLEPDLPHPLEENDLIRIGPWTFRVTFDRSRTYMATIADDDIAPSRVERVSTVELVQHRLHLILDGATRINSARDEDELAYAVVDSALSGTSFDRAALIREYDKASRVEILYHKTKNSAATTISEQPSDNFTFSRSLLKAASTGQVARLTSDGHVPQGASIVSLGITAALCAPVLLGGTVAAFLYLDSRGKEIPSQEDAADFCQAIARMCGLSLANLKRLELEQRQRNMEADLTAAREAQQLIVPASVGELHRVRYAMRMEPGSFVAGDLFDIFPMDDSRIAFFIGDVTGEGIGAGILMATAQSHLHAALQRHTDPAAAVNEVNAYLCTRSPLGKFVSLWVGVLDVSEKILTYVDAGHGHWIHRSLDGTIKKAPRPGGTLVGIEASLNYESVQLKIENGDRIILFSDGLVEQTNPTGEQFGIDSLSDLLAKSSTASEDVERIFNAVEEHAVSTQLGDDATVASIEIM